MKFFSFTILLLVALGTSCKSPKKAIESAEFKNYYWGIKWSYMDSTGHYQGINTEQNCFPGFDCFDSLSYKTSVRIYDRSGTLSYNSSNNSENWICKDKPNQDFETGTYYYIITKSNHLDSSSVDTSLGTITILQK